MKDLDFDELDRAVSSLMTNVPKVDPNTSSDEEKPEKTLTLDASKTATDDVTPATPATTPTPSAPATTPSSSVAPATLPASKSPVTSPEPADKTPMVPPTPSVAARRGGRFMDVVHPSSDMKKPEPAKSPISRQGVTISPSSTATAAEPSQPPAEPKKPEPTTPPAHEPAAPTSEWPDPLDVANFKDESSAAPLTTPFLADAKVEKRPLGGVPPAEQTAPEPDTTGVGKEGLTANDANDQLPAKPSDVQAPLPEELQGDLVAIESGVSKNTPLPAAEPVPAEQPKQPEQAPAPTKTPMPLPSAPKAPEPTASVEKPGTTSIPQQYREEPSTGDKASGAIYDTADYHQPLAHPGKKKSSWLWVIWIVLILLLGAGAGAALYFFKII